MIKGNAATMIPISHVPSHLSSPIIYSLVFYLPQPQSLSLAYMWIGILGVLVSSFVSPQSLPSLSPPSPLPLPSLSPPLSLSPPSPLPLLSPPSPLPPFLFYFDSTRYSGNVRQHSHNQSQPSRTHPCSWTIPSKKSNQAPSQAKRHYVFLFLDTIRILFWSFVICHESS